MSRLLLFIVLGGFLTYSITNLSMNNNVTRGTENSVTSFSYNQARNIANSTVQMALSRLADDINWRVTTPATVELYEGYATYTITTVNNNPSGDDDDDDDDGDDDDDDGHGDDDDDDDDDDGHGHHGDDDDDDGHGDDDDDDDGHGDDDDDDDGHGDDDDDDGHGDDDDDDGHGDDDDDDGHGDDDDDDDGNSINDELYKMMRIDVTAHYNKIEKSITVFANGMDVNNVKLPVSVKAAITTNNTVTTLGNLIIDGRNHNSNGSLISGNGKYGIWSTESINQGGSSQIGGTFSSTNYSPSRPADPHILAGNRNWSGDYPDTPDEVFGGTDMGYPDGTLKKAAIYGLKGSQYVTDPALLHHPLKGITYVELSSGESWTNANIDGEGILVVHNSNKNAIINNLNHATFKGLIIADDIIHIHSDIIGAVFVLTENPSEGNSIGNGNGSVLYSSEALKEVFQESELMSKTNFGFGKTRVNITRWLE